MSRPKLSELVAGSFDGLNTKIANLEAQVKTLKENPMQILTNDMIVGLQDVLAGRKKKFKAHGISPEMVNDYLTGLGFTKGEMDTNGWQWDYWINFEKDDQVYQMFGTGWDGSMEFGPKEE